VRTPASVALAASHIGPHIVRVADLAGTFVFAVEGALAAIAARFDPVGVLVLAFVTAVGGGVVRDVVLGLRPAAIARVEYPTIVIVAAAITWLASAALGAIPPVLAITLDAAGLALFAVAGTEKAREHGVHPLPACFLGTVGAVGGGVIRDVLLNRVPGILHSDIYASAAFVAAVIVVAGRAVGVGPRPAAIVAALACFGLRLIAVAYGWRLPTLPVG
jgi:uncharacterized membrane protein YeiH